MASRITVAVKGHDGKSSATYLVAEDFDAVMENVVPTRQPSSAFEVRSRLVYTRDDGGGRVFIAPQTIVAVEENVAAD